jgi:DNA repair protein RadC
VAVVLAHNHPSGDISASTADMLMTRNVKTALAGLDIDLYDHVIVGHGAHLSFKAEGYL